MAITYTSVFTDKRLGSDAMTPIQCKSAWLKALGDKDREPHKKLVWVEKLGKYEERDFIWCNMPAIYGGGAKKTRQLGSLSLRVLCVKCWFLFGFYSFKVRGDGGAEDERPRRDPKRNCRTGETQKRDCQQRVLNFVSHDASSEFFRPTALPVDYHDDAAMFSKSGGGADGRTASGGQGGPKDTKRTSTKTGKGGGCGDDKVLARTKFCTRILSMVKLCRSTIKDALSKRAELRVEQSKLYERFDGDFPRISALCRYLSITRQKLFRISVYSVLVGVGSS